jgi:hypothetical protein
MSKTNCNLTTESIYLHIGWIVSSQLAYMSFQRSSVQNPTWIVIKEKKCILRSSIKVYIQLIIHIDDREWNIAIIYGIVE